MRFHCLKYMNCRPHEAKPMPESKNWKMSLRVISNLNKLGRSISFLVSTKTKETIRTAIVKPLQNVQIQQEFCLMVLFHNYMYANISLQTDSRLGTHAQVRTSWQAKGRGEVWGRSACRLASLANSFSQLPGHGLT